MPSSGLGHAGAEQLGDLLQLAPGAAGALPGQDGDLAAGVEDLGRPEDGLVVGRGDGPVGPDRRGHHLEGVGRRGIGELLDVGRDDQRGGRPLGHGDADGPVQHVGQLLGDRHHLHVLAGDVLEQGQQVDFLLVGAAHGAAVGLADDRDDGHVVQLGVVQAVEQVNGARARRGHAHADAAGELRVADGLEGGHLLVPGLDELGLVIRPAPGGQDAVDPVAGVGEYVPHVPCAQPLEQVIGNCRCHVYASVACRSSGNHRRPGGRRPGRPPP